MIKQVAIDLRNNSIEINEVCIKPIPEGDDLSFESPILCGYGIIGINRLKVCSSKESSKVGGYFAHSLKENGYDQILIKGKSSKSVYIYIDKYNIEIKDASEFYSSNIEETHRNIKNRLKENEVEIACIGLAGIKKVDFSRIMFNNNKSCGKNGLGRLMGEKNIKAIVLKRQEDNQVIKNNSVLEINRLICKNMKNYNIDSYFDDENYCYGCNMNCKSTSIKKLISKGYDEEFSFKLDNLCNEYGMDSFTFADIINDKLSLEENIEKIINEEKMIIKREENKKKENKLDEVGFCKFLINKNIITEEQIDKLIKDLNLK